MHEPPEFFLNTCLTGHSEEECFLVMVNKIELWGGGVINEGSYHSNGGTH